MNYLLVAGKAWIWEIWMWKSVRQCYSLIYNASERWTKLKRSNKHIKQFKNIHSLLNFLHITEHVSCLKLGQIFGLVCLALGLETNRRLESCTLNWSDGGFVWKTFKILGFWATTVQWKDINISRKIYCSVESYKYF